MNSQTLLRPLTTADFPVLTQLAHTIWYQHYPAIISHEQIAYMLDGRFSDEKLLRYIDSSTQWFWLLWQNEQAVGYLSCALQPENQSLKLEQIYLLRDLKGQGLGKGLMRHCCEFARAKQCRSVWLTVNKFNHDSIAFYKANGFIVREEAQFDIGNGYVMDDFVMELKW